MKIFQTFYLTWCCAKYVLLVLLVGGWWDQQDRSDQHYVNFLPTGKLQKDRRKMREKRRSTGVVYLGCQANDSNGTTTAEEEDDEVVVEEDEETVKNTKQNEISASSTGADTEGN